MNLPNPKMVGFTKERSLSDEDLGLEAARTIVLTDSNIKETLIKTKVNNSYDNNVKYLNTCGIIALQDTMEALSGPGAKDFLIKDGLI